MVRILTVITFLVLSCNIVAQTPTYGLLSYSEESIEGYNLFSSGRNTFLVDNCGREVNRWSSTYQPGLSVYLTPEGNLLRTGRVSSPVFSGGGIGGVFELFDWDGNLLWSYAISNLLYHTHHDIALLPNGNFLAVAWNRMSAQEALSNGRSTTNDLWLEAILEIKILPENNAEIVWSWNLKDHLIQDEFPDALNYGDVSAHPGKVDFNYISSEVNQESDWIHINSIDYNVTLDQIIVSSRHLSEVWIIDHSTTTEEAMTSYGGNSGKGGDLLYRYGNPEVYKRGSLEDKVFGLQHNASWVQESDDKLRFTVFNNNYQPGISRAEMYTLPIDGSYNYLLEDLGAYGPNTTSWDYTNDEYFSSRLSSVQLLPDNRFLICYGQLGIFIEVDKDGKEIWKYKNPAFNSGTFAMQGSNSPLANVVFKVERYLPDFKGFEGKDLTPGSPIELDPYPTDCITSDVLDYSNYTSPIIYKAIIGNKLEVSLSKAISSLSLVTIEGKVLWSTSVEAGTHAFDIDYLPRGIYFLVTADKSVEISKMVKLD